MALRHAVAAPIIKPGDTVKDKYDVVRSLGQGGFGAVFEVCNKKTKERFALKMELEEPKNDDPGLDLEVGVMKRIQRSKHAIRYVDSGKINNLTFVIMDLVGNNLSDLRRLSPDTRFTLSTALRLGLQCFEGIQDMHRFGLLHRDIKPSNFAIGRTLDDCRIVYILDFGMVRRFRLKNGKVRPARKLVGFRGTAKYASLACHKNQDLGRVDDIWSWLYMFVEFQVGKLPWRKETLKDKIYPIKADQSYTKLYVGLEPENQRIAFQLMSVKYADKPQYRWYRQQITSMMQRKSIFFDEPYDWEPRGASYEQLKLYCPVPTERLITKKSIKQRSTSEGSTSEESLTSDKTE